MAGSLSWMDAPSPSEDGWPEDGWPIDGWPYADNGDAPDLLDVEAALDDDLVSLHAVGTHLLDRLDPLERTVVAARFGLEGHPAQSMKQLQHDLGLSRADVRVALGDGLAKLRAQLA